jgi:toxin ParE1/3/4
MRAKPVLARELARRDIDGAVAHYLAEASEKVALGFIDALEQAYMHIGRHPGTGSLRYAHELDLPGLRCRKLNRYPYVIFYVERDDRIDVWRVLHGFRDIPGSLREGDDRRG